MEAKQEQPEEQYTRELATQIGRFMAFSELEIRKRMQIGTCLSDDYRSYRIMNRPRLPHTVIDEIIDMCKAEFGCSRAQMHILLTETERVRKTFETQHEVYTGGHYVVYIVREVGRLLAKLISKGTLTVHSMDSDREIVSQIEVYKTLETLVRAADLESFEPERIEQIPSDSTTERVLAKYGC